MKYDLSKQFDKKRAEEKFRFYLEKGNKIELKILREKRTLKQNSYLHGVVIPIYAIEVGNCTIEEAKTDLKREFGLIYEKNGKKYLRSTANLDTIETVNFIEFIRNQAGLQGCHIPSPEEYKQNQFDIDKEIELNREFIGYSKE